MVAVVVGDERAAHPEIRLRLVLRLVEVVERPRGPVPAKPVEPVHAGALEQLAQLCDVLSSHLLLDAVGAEAGDQKRIMTPSAAIAAGADYLVVGRPIVAASDPKAAADAIVAEIAAAAAKQS